ncbi:cytochrome c-type biogenesis protein CcmH [Hahella aquimaris]|uniref:cytochrome c-type biogenesis protein n=1 Tax=Hahella sp. HNIBRBA332 TaxID=3015983 RepID=UPI00273B5983|nr:cytochrome c-type biogenesis protein [Hahella sp. HNIBRBA332]WLQ17215.1 cytochrome c-type biogenesis protein CcmH [Hahella sp. HNIBRBA332]
MIAQRLLISLAALWMSAVAWAIDDYQFSSEEGRERYQTLTYELRCPLCQNQNISDSTAPIAKDLRREVHRMIEEGKSDDDIVDFMVDRYGDFVLYRPRLNAQTAALWLGPVTVVTLGLSILLYVARRRRRSLGESTELSDEEQARLRALLQQTSSEESEQK